MMPQAATTWSTDGVHSADRFAYWHDAVCAAVLNVGTEKPPAEGFRGQIRAQRVGSVGLATFTSCGHAIRRTARHIRMASDESFLVSLQVGGTGQISQGDDAAVLRPGEMALVDGARPFTVAFPSDVERIVGVIPRRTLAARAPWLDRAGVRTVTAGSLPAELLRMYMTRLSAAEWRTPRETGDVLAEHLVSLLCLATAGDAVRPSPASLRQLRRDALLAYVRQNLADAALSPSRAAEHLRVSVRTIHTTLEPTGYSFAELVLAQRLDACAETLRANATELVSSVALAWGFNDIAYFNKAFKARFGMTPRDYRHNA